MDNSTNFDVQACMTNGVENIVKEALRATLTNPNSKLFTYLRDSGMLNDDHDGGCVLFNRKELVEKVL